MKGFMKLQLHRTGKMKYFTELQLHGMGKVKGFTELQLHRMGKMKGFTELQLHRMGKGQYFTVLQPFEPKNSEVIFSQMTNWVRLKFLRQVYTSPMHLHTKN